MVFLRTLIY